MEVSYKNALEKHEVHKNAPGGWDAALRPCVSLAGAKRPKNALQGITLSQNQDFHKNFLNFMNKKCDGFPNLLE